MTVATGYLGLPGVRRWSLEVTEVSDLTPRMRRTRLAGAGLETFEHLPGQDVMLIFPGHPDGRAMHRRYTIRRFDPVLLSLELNFVMHGDGPAARWARSAGPGSRIDVAGPRGKITLVEEADWHLFAGDATALPVTFAMMEALSSGVHARAFLEVDGPDEEQPLSKGASSHQDVTWLYRGGTLGRPDAGLADVLSHVELPEGRGHVYLAGEVGLVSTLRRAMLGRGLAPEQIAAKAYWNRGRANASHGEPERRPD